MSLSTTGQIKEEIELCLLQNGCREFMYGWTQEKALVQFSINGKRYRMTLDMPSKKDFERTSTGRLRSSDLVFSDWQKAQKEIWIALLESVRSKFKFVRMNASTIEREFLAYIVLPDGGMVGDYAEDMVNTAYEEENEMLRSGD